MPHFFQRFFIFTIQTESVAKNGLLAFRKSAQDLADQVRIGFFLEFFIRSFRVFVLDNIGKGIGILVRAADWGVQ